MEEDDAVYLCQVKVGINDMITERVKLNVKTPVKILDSSTTELTVVEGQSASMECDTSGYPAPAVEWSRTDGRVMFNSQTKATLLLAFFHPTATTSARLPGRSRTWADACASVGVSCC